MLKSSILEVQAKTPFLTHNIPFFINHQDQCHLNLYYQNDYQKLQ